MRPSIHGHLSQSRADEQRRGEGGVGQSFTFLKKGILFSFARGDMTLFGLALGERRLTGSSLSSGSKPVASMSMATHTDRQEHRHTGVNTGVNTGSHRHRGMFHINSSTKKMQD